jgi:DNA-binding NarL/FixJ family response regulator
MNKAPTSTTDKVEYISEQGAHNAKQRLLLCCEKPIIADGFSALLSRESDIDIVGQTLGKQVISETRRLAPDIVLVVSPALTIVAHKQELATLADLAKVMVIAKSENIHRSVEVLQVGVRAVLSLDTSSDQLLQAVRMVIGGDVLLIPEGAQHALRPLTAPSVPSNLLPTTVGMLTSREREVILLLARGLSNAEVADELSISMTTVRSHVHNVLRKLDVGTRAQAVAIAYESGLIMALETRAHP